MLTPEDKAHFCPRCGEPFPDLDDADGLASWVIVANGAEVVCPGCATLIDRARDRS